MAKEITDEILMFITKASLNLGAASERACKAHDFILAEELVDAARKVERIEARLTGGKIDRTEMKMEE